MQKDMAIRKWQEVKDKVIMIKGNDFDEIRKQFPEDAEKNYDISVGLDWSDLSVVVCLAMPWQRFTDEWEPIGWESVKEDFNETIRKHGK